MNMITAILNGIVKKHYASESLVSRFSNSLALYLLSLSDIIAVICRSKGFLIMPVSWKLPCPTGPAGFPYRAGSNETIGRCAGNMRSTPLLFPMATKGAA